MNEVDDFKFHSYINEDVESAGSKSSNGKIEGRSKSTIVIPHMCKLFCHGEDCRYCKPESKFSGEDMVIDGLYSSWVTNNILAMARPSTNYIGKFDIVKNFIDLNVKTVINMQMPGEHEFCGYPLENSGFSYDSYVFMNSGIDYFNFPCEDYGVLPVERLLDIVKIMQHQITRGKIAVHCHAGLGRTGLVIACYLVFNERLSDIEAINLVRKKRRNAIQTSLQVESIIQFTEYLKPFRCVIWTPTCKLYKFSLQEAVLRQKKLVHGNDAYILHSTPKILYLCLWKISQMAQGAVKTESDLFDSQECSSNENSLLNETMSTSNTESMINPSVMQSFLRWNKKIHRRFDKSISEDKADAIFSCFSSTYGDMNRLNEIKEELNTTDLTWKKLNMIDDMHLHCQIVMDYLHSLKFPVLRSMDLGILNDVDDNDPYSVLPRLESCVGRTLSVFLAFIHQCGRLPESKLWKLRSILFSGLTHKNVSFEKDDTSPCIVGPHDLNLSDRLTQNLKTFLLLV